MAVDEAGHEGEAVEIDCYKSCRLSCIRAFIYGQDIFSFHHDTFAFVQPLRLTVKEPHVIKGIAPRIVHIGSFLIYEPEKKVSMAVKNLCF